MIERYSAISRYSTEPAKVLPDAHIPTPKEKDYKVGYIVRYFLQRSNDGASPIYEVTPVTYKEFIQNPFFNGTFIDWRITGPSDEVRLSNSQSILLGSYTIRLLPLYLPNLLQFWKK
jgi:hypothetical protein